ncbi:TonB family protein [Anaeroselena agilis]|uniref:Energy transducer TonB n=1 Tax=Anaeroselena agilis TaxID=3063788 RepID=A0ABU3NSG1_9FIRM|nr:energy transducer TonB [Selenomonadales bacterium 4137-cl]
MKTKTWLPAAVISAVVHSLLLVAVAQGFGHMPPPEKEKPYIEVELTKVLPSQSILDTKPPPVDEPKPVDSAAPTEPAPAEPSPVVVDQPVKLTTGPPVAASRAGNEAVAIPSGGPAPKGAPGVSKGAPVKSARRLAVVYSPAPEYPADARSQRWEGTVRVDVLIDENGLVQDVQLAASSGSSSLDRAALDCLRTWRFRPAYQDGRPIAVRATVPVVFRLD